MGMMNKREIRKDALEHRRYIDPERRRNMDIDICSGLMSTSAYKKAEYVLCYVNYNDETDTHRIIRHAINDSKCVFIPKVTDPREGLMEFYRIESLVEAFGGYHGIPEPEEDARNSFEKIYQTLEWNQRQNVLAIVPGVAFDKNLDRLGYGKGFYDRYLKAHSDIYSVGICYDCQLYDSLPQEEGDVKMKLLISNEPETDYEQ